MKKTHTKANRTGANYLWLLPALSVLLLINTTPAVAEMVRVYVTNAAGDSVHVIDPATNKVVQQIKGIEAAHGINFSPDGARVYISNEADSTLDVVDRDSALDEFFHDGLARLIHFAFIEP